MNCPVCNVELHMTERQNVEIDYCPKCRGVWLDRGELDKIIEQSRGGTHDSHHVNPYQDTHKDLRHSEYDNRKYHQHKKHKKESFLERMFDFD